MIIESLSLVNFRNLKNLFLEFSKGVNIVYGQNGQGKTNLVEGIYLMSHSKSFRTRYDKMMVNFDEEVSYIKGKVLVDSTSHTIDIRLGAKSPKAINLNDYPIDRVSDMIGLVNVVIFSPEDIKIVTETPSVRRNFLDREISQIKPAYYSLISKHQFILKNKNALLKEDFTNPIMLDVYDEQIAEVSEKIMDNRRDFIEKISKIAGENHYYISDEREKLIVDYSPSLENWDKEGILSELKNTREYDIYRRTSSRGVHRDDMKLKLGDMDIKDFGSQGQKKTASISLKLAEIDLTYEKKGEYPIVILDDIFSELDKTRRQLIMEKFEDLQLFITTTDRIELENARYFFIENGQVMGED